MPRGLNLEDQARMQGWFVNPAIRGMDPIMADVRGGSRTFSAATTLFTITGLVAGKQYKVQFDYVSVTAVNLRVQGSLIGTIQNVVSPRVGKFVGIIFATATSATVEADSSAYTGTINNFRCMQVERPAGQLYYDPQFTNDNYWALGPACVIRGNAIIATGANLICKQRTNMLTATAYNFSFDVFVISASKLRVSNNSTDGTNVKVTSAVLSAGFQTLSGAFTTSGTEFDWFTIGADTAAFTGVISNLRITPALAANDLNFYTGQGNAYLTPTPRNAVHQYLRTPAGIWAEDALTQGVADPTFSNANALPNNWQLLPTYSQAATITFTKTERGRAQIRFQGNTTGNVYLQMGASTQLTVAPGDKLCGSWKWKFVGGSVANTNNHGLYIQENDAAGTLVNFSPIDHTFVGYPTADFTYHQGVITVAASVARANLGFIYATSGAYDFTIEICDVQLEKRLWRTSWSPVDRPVDNLRLAPGTEVLYLGTASRTVIIEAEAPRYNQNATLWAEYKDASNYIELQRRNLALFIKIVNGGTTVADTQIAVLPACSRFKVALSLAASQVYASVNGKTATSIAVTIPTALTIAAVGWGLAGVWNSTIGNIKTDTTAYSAANTAIASRITEDIFDDFDRANGALNGSTASTGQTWEVTGPHFATSTISSKKWVNTSSAGPLADYAIINLGRGLVYNGVSFNWDTGTTGGAVASMGATSNVLASADALHMATGDAAATWGVITGGTVDPTDGSWTFGTAMARDGSTAYSMAWFRNGDSVHWIGYDGASVMVNANDFAAKCGSYAYWEHYRSAAGLCLPQFTAVSAR